MVRFALFLILPFSMASAAVAAEPVGIPACDDFLSKYEACLSDKVPAAQQSAFKGQIEQLRASWLPLANSPQTRPTLESTCKMSADQMKLAVASYGCQF